LKEKSEHSFRQAISEGNADAWRDFLAEQAPVMYKLFMKQWPNPSMAEELTQKTVFDALRA